MVERWLDKVLNERRFEDALRQSTPSTTPTMPKRILRADGLVASLCNKSALLATSRTTIVETSLSTLLYDYFDRLKLSTISLILLQIGVTLALLPCLHFSSAIALSKVLSYLES